MIPKSKNRTFSPREELKDYEMQDILVSQQEESPFMIISIVSEGFDSPITVTWSDRFKKFEDFWMSHRIDSDISNVINSQVVDS